MNSAVGELSGELDADAAEELVLRVSVGSLEVPQIAEALQSLVFRQLSTIGVLPAGFKLVETVENSDSILSGIGVMPDGTRLIYVCVTSLQGTPIEFVVTPEQAQDAVEKLATMIDGDSEHFRRVRLRVLAAKTHLDIHVPPST